jgi:hypothetical protein
MRTILIILAGSGSLILANSVDSSAVQSANNRSRARFITKTISETTVHLISPYGVLARDDALLKPDSTLAKHAVVATNGAATPPPSTRQGASVADKPTILQHPPSAVPATSSNFLSNVGRAESDNEAAESLEYWPIMILVNGYDVEIPILKDNATAFCKSVQKDLSKGRGDPTVSQSVTNANTKTKSMGAGAGATASASGNEETMTTMTPTDEAGNAITTATVQVGFKSSDNGTLATSDMKSTAKRKKTSATPTPTDEATNEATNVLTNKNQSNSIPNLTGNQQSLRSSIPPTPAELDNAETPQETYTDTEEWKVANTTPSYSSKSASASNTSSSPMPSKKTTQIASSETDQPYYEEATSPPPGTVTEAGPSTKPPIRSNAVPSADVSSAAYERQGKSKNVENKREVSFLAKMDEGVPWYRAPVVWVKKWAGRIEFGHGKEQMAETEQEDENKGNEALEEDSTSTLLPPETAPTKLDNEEQEGSSKEEKATTSFINPATADDEDPNILPKFTKPKGEPETSAKANPSSSPSPSAVVNIATADTGAEHPKTTFWIHRSSSPTMNRTPTSTPTVSDTNEAEEDSASWKPTKTTTTTAKSQNNDDAEDEETTPDPTDTSKYIKPKPTKIPTSLSDLPTPTPPTGEATPTSDETSETNKHAPNTKGFLPMYIVLGSVFLFMGFWEMWRQTRNDFHWKRLDEWAGEYGRRLQKEGKTPVVYVSGRGEK